MVELIKTQPSKDVGMDLLRLGNEFQKISKRDKIVDCNFEKKLGVQLRKLDQEQRELDEHKAKYQKIMSRFNKAFNIKNPE